MAIKIQTKPSTYDLRTLLAPDPYANIISVSPNGTVTIKSELSPLMLGYYKEKNVRAIYVDISKLLIEDVKIDNIIQNYEASIICRFQDKQIILKTIEHFENYLVFTITQDITNNQGQYQLIFTLKEKQTDGNVENEIEWFTSSTFLGEVLPSLADNFYKGTEINLVSKEGLLQKPTIELKWDKNLLRFNNENPILGYSQDRFITDLKLAPSNLITDLRYDSYVVLTKEDFSITYNHKLTKNHSFLTKEVTDEPGIWFISIAIVGETQVLFSNKLSIQVLDNTLTDNPNIRTINLKLINDKDNKEIKVTEEPDATLYHNLTYSGQELDNILDTVNEGLKDDNYLVLKCGTSAEK